MSIIIYIFTTYDTPDNHTGQPYTTLQDKTKRTGKTEQIRVKPEKDVTYEL
jgi:hypothetical protein